MTDQDRLDILDSCTKMIQLMPEGLEFVKEHLERHETAAAQGQAHIVLAILLLVSEALQMAFPIPEPTKD